MKAFTTSTANYTSLSIHARYLVRDNLSVEDVSIVACGTLKEVFRKRVSTFLDFHEPVWHFDSDLWILQKRELPVPQGHVFFAAPCDGMDKAYLQSPVPPSSAFDTCLIGFDMGDARVRKSLERVLSQQGDSPQEATRLLNIEFHSQSWALPARMSNVWNWCGKPNHLTVGLHAAMKKDKEEWLKSMLP